MLDMYMLTESAVGYKRHSYSSFFRSFALHFRSCVCVLILQRLLIMLKKRQILLRQINMSVFLYSALIIINSRFSLKKLVANNDSSLSPPTG
jgi:hypothetical protein